MCLVCSNRCLSREVVMVLLKSLCSSVKKSSKMPFNGWSSSSRFPSLNRTLGRLGRDGSLTLLRFRSRATGECWSSSASVARPFPFRSVLILGGGAACLRLVVGGVELTTSTSASSVINRTTADLRLRPLAGLLIGEGAGAIGEEVEAIDDSRSVGWSIGKEEWGS